MNEIPIEQVIADMVNSDQLRIVMNNGELCLQVVDLYRNEEISTNKEGVNSFEFGDETSVNNLKEGN